MGARPALKGGRLRDDVHLISVGDHFDYDLRIPDIARGEGLRTLRWDGRDAVYDLGVLPPREGVAELILVDGELREADNRAALLELAPSRE
ncbi:MAG: hypothetical protein R3A52_23720 [Polyangiales bacterium]